MGRRQRKRDQLDALRDAFWAPEHSEPVRVADTFDARAAYERRSLSEQLLAAVDHFMRERNVTQLQLARELGVSEGRVSQILSGDQNLTLKTLASVAAALKAHFVVDLEPARGGTWEGPTDDDIPRGNIAIPTAPRRTLANR
ncbi:MAG: hypothetical protein QOJ29_2378 [Thermoleophilaceae bacterium]|jgi:antitoxin component HigA of HigAB toxin-antitoxin module|nr:hypothetical protein [Thermoleophilaceae bacterium]